MRYWSVLILAFLVTTAEAQQYTVEVLPSEGYIWTVMNDFGALGGSYFSDNGDSKLVRRNPSGTLDLPTSMAGEDFIPHAMNNRGDITGNYSGQEGMYSFVYDSVLTPIPVGQCYDINNRGDVLGIGSHNGVGQVISWNHGVTHGYGGGATPGYGVTTTSINDNGEVVGYENDREFTYTNALYWSPEGEVRIIGQGFANSINNNGYSVGDTGYIYLHGEPVAPYWGNGFYINDRGSVASNGTIMRNGVLEFMPDLLAGTGWGWDYTSDGVLDFNNRDEFLVRFYRNGGYTRAILRPVPEPSTLVAFGLGGLALLARRRLIRK